MAQRESGILTRGAFAVCEPAPAGIRLQVGFSTYEGQAHVAHLLAWRFAQQEARRRRREDLTLWLWPDES